MIENVTGQWIRRVYLSGELFRLPPIVHFSNKSLLPELTMRKILNLTFALTVFASTASSQIAAKDGSSRLREVLPPDVAQRVIALIADARAQQLPADALENRALKFAAKGVDPKAIERSVGEQAERMAAARNSLAQGRQSPPAGDEIEAGAEAIRKGIDGQAISLLAKNAPAGRSLAVPLFVIGSLTDRGLPSDEALNRVLDRLKARASDADLESMPGQLPARIPPGQAKKDGATGREFGQGHNPSAGRPASAGPPAGVPGNPGKKANPGQSRRPPKPNK